MKRIILIGLAVFTTVIVNAQKSKTDSKNKFADLALTVGSGQGSAAASYVYNWKFGFGKKKHWEAGVGARLTSSFGTKLEYTTAGPAKLTRTNTTPFLIVFAGQKIENWDTVTVQRPFTNSLNLTANFGYNFTPKWSAGFNIDLIGFTVGRKSSAVLVSNGLTTTEPTAKPTAFNVLLTGDHDLGSLNSEFFVKYTLNKRWAIRGVYQFLFTEYTTTTIKQIAPDGTAVDRFRNKANNFGFAVAYHF